MGHPGGPQTQTVGGLWNFVHLPGAFCMPSSYGCSEQRSKGANFWSDSALEVTKPRDGRVAGG